MSPRIRPARLIRDLVAPVFCLLAFGLAAWIYLAEPVATDRRLTVSAGSAKGLRQELAQVLADKVRPLGLNLSVRATRGSDAALDLVDSGALDLALVQGGLDLGDRTNLRQVVALHVEPLHLLVRSELHPQVEGHLKALRGKVVNLSEPGSGTHALALEVLEFVGLKAGTRVGTAEGAAGDYIATTLSYDQLEAIRDPAALPDAIFTVSSLPSPVVRALVDRWGYRLVALPFGEAFTLDLIDDEAADGLAPSPLEGRRRPGVDRVHVSTARIPAYTYGVQPGVPPGPIETLGTRLILVAHRAVDPASVVDLLEAIFTTDFSHVVKPPIDAASLERPPELPWHDGTRQFLDRNKPLIFGDLIDSLEKSLSVVGALIGGLFFLWQWIRQRVRRRQDRGFESYIRKVTDLENQAVRLELSSQIDLRELIRIQAELSRLKGEALEKFAQGDIDGEQLMSGFLVHVNDTRAYLTRLILHERENLEHRAEAAQRSARSLWHEEIESDPTP